MAELLMMLAFGAVTWAALSIGTAWQKVQNGKYYIPPTAPSFPDDDTTSRSDELD